MRQSRERPSFSSVASQLLQPPYRLRTVSVEAVVGTASEGGTLLGLAGSDADLLEQICGEALGDAGVDGGRFFARLRQGYGLGVALGLPRDVTELIYARAHRWFVAGR